MWYYKISEVYMTDLPALEALLRSLKPDWRQIAVAGKKFPESRWREAILHFLFGIWGNDPIVMGNPQITFGEMTLRLDKKERKYYGFGHFGPDGERPIELIDRRIHTFPDQREVEIGLVRFVKDPDVPMITIQLDKAGWLHLWKVERRGEYRCYAEDMPQRDPHI